MLYVGILILLIILKVDCIDKEEHYRECISAMDERFLINDIKMLNQTQIDFIHNLYEQVYHCAKNSASATTSTSFSSDPSLPASNNFFSNLIVFDNIFENFAAFTVILASIFEIFCRFQYHRFQLKLLSTGLSEVISVSAPLDSTMYSNDFSAASFSRQPIQQSSIQRISEPFRYKALNGPWNTSFKGKNV